jgi:hypothetical protein
MCMYVYVCLGGWKHLQSPICMRVGMCANEFFCLYVLSRTFMYLHIHVRVCVCVCVCLVGSGHI